MSGGTGSSHRTGLAERLESEAVTGSGERGNMFLDAQTSARLSAFKARLRALESPMVKENPGGDKFSCGGVCLFQLGLGSTVHYTVKKVSDFSVPSREH